MSEDQELLARISQLAGMGQMCANLGYDPDRYLGHINLHKTQPSSPQAVDPGQTRSDLTKTSAIRGHTTWRPPRPAPYTARGRGASRRYPTSHSLVLRTESSRSPAVKSGGLEALQPTPAYVSKRGRHRQLINSLVLDRVTQQRKQAIEESRQRRVLMDDQRERQQMHQYMEGLGANQEGLAVQTPRTPNSTLHQIEVDGLTFQILKNGSKLTRIRG